MASAKTQPTRTRAFYITEKVVDEKTRTARVAFSSEKPVRAFDASTGREYWEILDHGDKVDMSRMMSGAPVLKDHDKRAQVGVVDAASIDVGERVGRATLRFSGSARGLEEFQDVVDGIRTKISFGYVPGKGERAPEHDQDGIPAMRFRSWMPYEISTVAVPEDDSVGLGRSYGADGGDAEEIAPEQTEKTTPTQKTRTMSDTNAPPAEPKEPAVDMNKLRGEIRAAEMDRANNIRAFAGRVSIADSEVEKAIKEGTEFDTFTRSFTQGAISQVKPSESTRGHGPLADLDLGMNEKERQRFSIVSAIRSIVKGDRLEGLEKEVSDATGKLMGADGSNRSIHLPLDILRSELNGRARALEAGAASEGGYSVATDLGGMIGLLRNKTQVLALGATQLTGLRGNLSLPRQDGAATASWVDEEGSVSDSAQTLGQLSFTPNRLAARTVYSDQLVAQSSIGIEAFVRGDLMRVTAIALDAAALHGTGTSNQPLGLDGVTGIGAVTFGGAPTWADIVEFETDIAAANGDVGTMAFLTSPAVRGKWKTTVRVASTDSIFLTEGNEANGYPVVVSNNVVGDIVFFGVWSQLTIATWGAMSLIVDPYSKAATGQHAVTACSFHDVGCLQPSAFSVSADSGAQ